MKSYKELLHDLDIEVMIKFIDKKEMIEKIKICDFDYIQGFVVSKPKNLKNLKGML